MLIERFGLEQIQHVTLLGIGMGSQETLTIQGQRALEQAELLIGAKRMTDAVKMPHHAVVHEYLSAVSYTHLDVYKRQGHHK